MTPDGPEVQSDRRLRLMMTAGLVGIGAAHVIAASIVDLSGEDMTGRG